MLKKKLTHKLEKTKRKKEEIKYVWRHPLKLFEKAICFSVFIVCVFLSLILIKENKNKTQNGLRLRD
jgi:hypothetical protein